MAEAELRKTYAALHLPQDAYETFKALATQHLDGVSAARNLVPTDNDDQVTVAVQFLLRYGARLWPAPANFSERLPRRNEIGRNAYNKFMEKQYKQAAPIFITKEPLIGRSKESAYELFRKNIQRTTPRGQGRSKADLWRDLSDAEKDTWRREGELFSCMTKSAQARPTTTGEAKLHNLILEYFSILRRCKAEAVEEPDTPDELVEMILGYSSISNSQGLPTGDGSRSGTLCQE